MYKSYLYYATDAIGHRGSTQTRPTFSLRVFSFFSAFKDKLEENNLCITDSFSPHSFACSLSRVLFLSLSLSRLFLSFILNYLISAMSHFINYLKTIFYTIMYV